MENNEQDNQIIIYQSDDGRTSVDVKFQGETAWLTQAQLVNLFGSSKANISEHIKHIFEEGELDQDSVVRKFRTTAADGKVYSVDHYNLDMIISLGYRIKSSIATHFRVWATTRLREYIVKGFTMDDERLKGTAGGSYWKELLDRIRDIRSSEKVLYRQVLDLYATSMDYDPNTPESIKFFKIVQNKLHYAAHGHTAAEVIAKRADAGQPFMGLLAFSGGAITRKDIGIAKNYLTEKELKKLNNMVSAYFDLAEVKAMNQEPMRMKNWIAQLDRLIQAFDGKLLDNAGSISHEQAIQKAEAEYKKYQTAVISAVEQAYMDTIRAAQKKAEKKTKDEN